MTRAAVLLGILSALLLAPAASAAAPNYVLVTGPGLEKPVLLPSWVENHRFLIAVTSVPRADAALVRSLPGRPRLDLAMCWGWFDRPPPKWPSEANQHAWFYPAHRGRPAVYDVSAFGRRTVVPVPPMALAILARHGVPTRL